MRGGISRVLRIESARLLEVAKCAEQILRGAFRIAFGLLLAALRLAVALVEVQLFKLPPHFLFAGLRVAMFGDMRERLLKVVPAPTGTFRPLPRDYSLVAASPARCSILPAFASRSASFCSTRFSPACAT